MAPSVLQRRLLVLPLLLLVSVACASESADSRESQPCEPGRPHEPGKSWVTTEVQGIEREYLLFVPSGYDGSVPSALLLTFHGAGPTPDDRPRSEFEFDEIWNESSFELPSDMVVASPQGSGDSWNYSPRSEDVEFASTVLDDVMSRLCIDSHRIFATGVSSGGMLVSSLVCSLSDRLAAVGAAIGMIDPFDRCAEPPSALPLVSIAGGEDSRTQRHVAAHRSWAANNGCESEPVTTTSFPGVTTTKYAGCEDSASVVLHAVEGMGHQQARRSCDNVPEAVRDTVCFQAGEFDFRTIQMDFFAEHSEP